MRHQKILIIIIIFSLIQNINTLQCGDEQIDNCAECSTEDGKTGTCAKCENNYFQFLFNYLCLPCDHDMYGDPGCQGNCQRDENSIFKCDEFGCKEGFYSIGKAVCWNCGLGSQYCAKCSNLPPLPYSANETDERLFTCNECIDTTNYRIFSDGKCHHCSKPYCSECHFYENTTKSVCDKCYYDYYLSGENCRRCLHYGIYGGYCRRCTDDITDYDNIFCYCNTTYYQSSPRECNKCSNGCRSCVYDNYLKGPRCLSCYSNFALNRRGTCTYCGVGCGFCSINTNDSPVCYYCYGGYKLINGKCYNCPPNCEACTYDEETNGFICDRCFYYAAMDENKNCVHCPNFCNTCKFDTNKSLKCTSCYNYYPSSYYALNTNSLCEKCPSQCQGCRWIESRGGFGCTGCFYGSALKDNECLRCPTIPELGVGCEQCSYDQSQNKFKCYRCINRDYTNVTNSYECIPNTDSSNKQLYGCLLGTYNYALNKYECNICKPEFIPILNDKNCRPPSMAGLNSFCRGAINIGSEENPIYSCISCKSSIYVNVTDYRNSSNCYERKNELILCEKATKDESGNIQCIQCLGNFQFTFSETYNKNICSDYCGVDGFRKNNWCYKCTDFNKGCVGERGCEYRSSNNQLNCNECAVGYYQYTYGQCFPCRVGSSTCLECHVNNNNFECEKCIDGYFVNENTKKCQLIVCDEHPEIMSGCIICSDNLNIYKSLGKCQACKDGYFKTKNDTCIHCKAKKNGGPACELCGYELNEEGNETDNIICKHCPEGFLTSDGKCYKCKDELEDGCQNCALKVNNITQTEKLVCTACKDDYILSKNSHCIHFNSYVYKIPFCSDQYDYLEKNIIIDNNMTSDNSLEEEEFDYNNTDTNNNNNKTFNYEYKVHSICYSCKEGYVKKDDLCVPLNVSNCSLSSFLLNNTVYDTEEEGNYPYIDLKDNYNRCNSLCKGSKYVNISYYYEITEQVKVYYYENTNDNFTDNNAQYNNYSKDYDYEKKDEFNNNKDKDDLFITDSLDSDFNEFNSDIIDNENIQRERELIEAYEMKTFVYEVKINTLLENSEEYITNNSQIMNIISKSYLCLDNLGTGGIYSPENLRKCQNAKYFGNNDTYECTKCIDGYSLDDDTKICKQSIKVSMNLRPGFSNCYVTNIGTIANPIYSCYRCYNYYDLLITSDTGAKFCANKYGELSGCTEAYADTTYLNNVYNCINCSFGYISYYNIFFEKIICQDIYRPPDKIKEFDSTIFDPGEVEHTLAVNGTCENEKLFTPDGQYCYACNNRTVGMVGCKGKCLFNEKKNITLKCEEGMCKTGYIEKTKGVCEPCYTINDGCIECHYENDYLRGYYGFKRKRRFSCDQCDNGYLISEDGTCHHCSTLGFDNCKNCGVDKEHDNEIICVECQPGYFTNDQGKCIRCDENKIRGKENTCISCDDIENGGIEGCLSCNNVNNNPQCNLCKPGFILSKDNYTCLRISSNVDLEELAHCQLTYVNANNHYECAKCDKGYVLLEEDNLIKCFNKEFIDAVNPDLCEIFTNLGTDDKPKYSCVKCRNNNLEYWNKESIIRITYQKNSTAMCYYRREYYYLDNCTEITNIVEEEREKYNCTECVEDNILYYHKDTDAYICRYKFYEKQCVVKYCKTCVPGNNYFCSLCLPADYEVSPLTGACVKKMEKAPEVYFKDIFRYQTNQYKQIGGRLMHGPFFSLRGLTNSQINTDHAFLVLLTFKLQVTRNNRNLEENKSVKTYCQIVESCDETDGEPNIADFDCIGDLEEEEELTDYNLANIEESPENNSTGLFETSNLNKLVEETDLSTLDTKTETTFKLENFTDLAIFNLDQVNDIISKDYHFDFTLNGKLNRELQAESRPVSIPLNQINNKTVDCTFIIKANKIAELKCDFNLEEYKANHNEFSLKVTEIKDSSDNPIYLSRINEVKLIHQEEEDDGINVAVVVGSVVASVVVAGGGIGVGIYLYKAHKLKKLLKNNVNHNNVSQNINNNQADEQDSHRKIIRFEN